MTDPTGTITVAQAAQALGVSERTVWRYLKSGRLPGETIGEPGAQRTLIPSQAVDALNGSRGGADAEALRVERDRLAAELAAARAERDALRGRVSVLQRALSQPLRPGIAERALGRALSVVARFREPRMSSIRSSY
jgi:excisionase family DNA binding protein